MFFTAWSTLRGYACAVVICWSTSAMAIDTARLWFPDWYPTGKPVLISPVSGS